MKIRIIISLIIISLLAACSENNRENRKDNLSSRDGETIIGQTVELPEMEAFYRDKIVKISFNSYKNKWLILFFYPGDFTFVCPTELKELSEYYNDFKAGGAEVFTISTDSPHVHRAWRKDSPYLKDISFPMLSDRSGALSRLMGVYRNEKGSSIRASFILNPERKIVSADYSDDSVGRNIGELLRKFDAAVAVEKGGGGMCPAGWISGDELIKNE